VNVITPSVVQGARLRARIAAGGFGGKLFEKASAAAHLGVATERYVAEVIGFLASDRSQRDGSGHQRQWGDLGRLTRISSSAR
jgi:2-hydroxycyclohexanecarboxyl-CoA dehydrogenase